MSTVVIVLVCAAPIVGLLVFLGSHQIRRERQAMRDFAALIDDGAVAGRRVTGRWKGVNVSIGFFGRVEPYVFLTAVAAARQSSPFVALMLPRGDRSPSRPEPPPDAPDWIVALDRKYDADCAPVEMFRIVFDEDTARLLARLSETEIEILPTQVNIQQREILYEADALRPLLDTARQLAARLDAVHGLLVGATPADQEQREREVVQFLRRFQRV